MIMSYDLLFTYDVITHCVPRCRFASQSFFLQINCIFSASFSCSSFYIFVFSSSSCSAIQSNSQIFKILRFSNFLDFQTSQIFKLLTFARAYSLKSFYLSCDYLTVARHYKEPSNIFLTTFVYTFALLLSKRSNCTSSTLTFGLSKG